MSEYCVVKTTFENESQAKKIAEILLEDKLIACAQISTIESIYLWDGQMVNQKEYLLTAKTKSALYKKVEERVVELHSYQVPQIIKLPIIDGFNDYLSWVDGEVK